MKSSGAASSRRLPILAGGLLVAIFFIAVQVIPASAHSTGSADSTAFVRIIHAAPDVGTVDVFVDGNKMLSNFQYGTVTGYVPLPNGQHKVQVALIGKGVNASVITQMINMQAGQVYTVAALGTMATGFSLQVFTDNNVVVGNTAKVRVYHLSPGTGDVSVSESGSTVVNSLAYQQASSYISVSPGSYTLNIKPSQDNTAIPVQATLKPWTVTSVFAIGMFNQTPKLQFIASQVNGVPGMPGTGSDPNPAAAQAATANTAPISPWLLILPLLFALGAGVTIRKVAMQKR